MDVLLATLGELFGRDFLNFGVELLLEEGKGLLDIELVDDLLHVAAVLGNGACGLLETLLGLLGGLAFLRLAVGATEDVLDGVDYLVLGGVDALNLVECTVNHFPLQRGDVGVRPLLFDGLGGDILVLVAGENPTLEEGFGHGSVEIVEELLAHLVDKENLALLVVGFLYLGSDGLAELVDGLDTFAREHLLKEFFVNLSRGDARNTADGDFDIGLELLGGSGVEAEYLLELRGGEGLAGVEDDLFFSLLANKGSSKFGIFHVGEFERAEDAQPTLFLGAFLGEFDGFAVDVVALADGVGSLKLAITLGDAVDLGVDIFGSDLDRAELGVDFRPVEVDLRSQSGIEIEGEVGTFGKVDGAVLLFVGEGRAEKLELLIVDVFVKRFTEEVLNGVGDHGGLVHALNQSHGSHSLTETGNGGLMLVFLQLLCDLLCIVAFRNLNLNTKVQFS